MEGIAAYIFVYFPVDWSNIELLSLNRQKGDCVDKI